MDIVEQIEGIMQNHQKETDQGTDCVAVLVGSTSDGTLAAQVD